MKKMKIIPLPFLVIALLSGDPTTAQIPILSIIQAAVKKVVQAMDLEVQKLQNKTIWLQDAQKTLENDMSALKLQDIAGWLDKQRALYAEYYQELWKVKEIISGYDRVKQVIALQTRIAKEYQQTYGRLSRDKHFSAAELDYMTQVYAGMLDQAAKNVDQLLLVVNSFLTQMSDARRMEIIDGAARGMQQNYNDLRDFGNQQILLSLQRGAEENDLESVKALYGL
jgi:hypothetical protein